MSLQIAWQKTAAMADVYGFCRVASDSKYFLEEVDGIIESANRAAFSDLDYSLIEKIRDNLADMGGCATTVQKHDEGYRTLLRTAYSNQRELAVACARYIANEGITVA
jgi:hypothetical protein